MTNMEKASQETSGPIFEQVNLHGELLTTPQAILKDLIKDAKEGKITAHDLVSITPETSTSSGRLLTCNNKDCGHSFYEVVVGHNGYSTCPRCGGIDFVANSPAVVDIIQSIRSGADAPLVTIEEDEKAKGKAPRLAAAIYEDDYYD